MRTDIHNFEKCDYQLFWQNNLQKLEEINNRIEKILITLEKKYIGFDDIYRQLNDEIDVLLSIYSSFNNLLGIEYLLKLKSLLNDYRERYTHDSIRFNVLFFLHSKIKELRDESFSKFPELAHRSEIIHKDKKPIITNIELPYKWVTFQRNKSWFITYYDNITVLKMEDIFCSIYEEGGVSYFSISEKKIKIIDLMGTFLKEQFERPNYYLLITKKNINICYAAYSMGKRLFAKSDIISKRLIKYNTLPNHAGHLRIFGNNHIYLS